LFGSTNAATYGGYLTNDSQPISVPEHGKKLRIELNDATASKVTEKIKPQRI
jgi:hypothetical protein